MNDGEPTALPLMAVGQLLARRIGLRLNPTVTGRLSRSVRQEADAHGLDVDAYCARLDGDPTLLQGLIDRITVQETSFFRDPVQLDAFQRYVLPGLRPPVSVWSAGCSNGQEAYTLAMILAESGIAGWQVTATDVATHALDRTRRARYSAKEVAGLGPDRRARWLTATDGGWEVVGELRDRVRVLHHNLVTAAPPFVPGACDVIFSRNVLIYLDSASIAATVEKLARWLPPAGWLFLGYSESLWQVTDVFRLVRIGEGFAYSLNDTSASPPPTPPPRPASGARSPRARLPRPSVRPPRRRRAAEAGFVADGDTSSTLLSAGQKAMNEGDFATAIVAFRKYAYLEPHRPVAHLHVGLALEAAGDAGAARRAFAAARAMLHRGDPADTESSLEGYRVEELARLLDDKLAAG